MVRSLQTDISLVFGLKEATPFLCLLLLFRLDCQYIGISANRAYIAPSCWLYKTVAQTLCQQLVQRWPNKYKRRLLLREKGRDLTQSCDKSPYTHRKIQQATWQQKTPPKNVDYTTIADRLRTVSWSNNSHPPGVVKPNYERSTFPLTATAV